ncbi:unnamed protein product [Auanema sp. JU1783]|nr:unnamed protein product [Auanema sp. JU1783]
MADKDYKVRRILSEEKGGASGLRGSSVQYLIDWEPSLVDARDVSNDARECFKFSVVVQGPCDLEENEEVSSEILEQDWIVLKVEKANPKNVTALRLDYQRLRAEYPQELIQYFESHACV